jgi:hypothetical protein
VNAREPASALRGRRAAFALSIADGRHVARESASSNPVVSDPDGATDDLFRTDVGGDRLFDDD